MTVRCSLVRSPIERHDLPDSAFTQPEQPSRERVVDDNHCRVAASLRGIERSGRTPGECPWC